MLSRHRRLLLLGVAGLATATPAPPPASGMSVVFLGRQESETDAASYDWTYDLGAAGPKTVIIWAFGVAAGSVTPTLPTVAGNGVDIIGQDGSSSRQLGAYSYTTTLGGSQTINTSYSGSLNRAGVAVYVIRDSFYSTYYQRSGSAPNTAAPGTGVAAGAIDIPAGGVGFSAAWVANAASPVTWTPALTADFNEQLGTGALWGSSVISTTAGTGVVFQADTGISAQHRILSFSWRP